MSLECKDENLAALHRVISEAKPKQPKPLPERRPLQHGWLVPLMLHADHFLWQRWSHWFDTASAGQTIAPIPRIEWQKHDAGFKMLDRSLSAITRHGDWQGWDSWAAFDYFMDWLLFAFGHAGQRELPEEQDDYRGASERLYQVFNLETLLAYPHDYLGNILAENHHGRHLGFFPTPLEVSDLMAQMTMGDGDARTKAVCDPCVGTGRMLLAASNYSYRLYGCDINATVIKAPLVNGFIYAPRLVRPFPFLDAPLCDPSQSERVSDSIAAEAKLPATEHDASEQWKFEPIKKRRKAGEPAAEQGLLFQP